MVKGMMARRKKIFTASLTGYSLWVLTVLSSFYFPEWPLAFAVPWQPLVTLGILFILTVLAAGRIPGQKYHPDTVIFTFLMGGRFIGLGAQTLFVRLTGVRFFHLPLGEIDFIIFTLLALGLIGYRSRSEGLAPNKSFAVWLPLLAAAVPVLVLATASRGPAADSYGLFYGFLAAALMVRAARLLGTPRHRFGAALLLTGLADMLVFAEYLPWSALIPPGLTVLLIPCPLMFLVYGEVSHG